MKQDERTYIPYTCHFCGKIIGYEGYEYIETKGKHTSGCIGGVYRKEGVSKMLHVIDNYYAQTNNYGYSILRDTGKQNPKTGEQTYIPLGYVGTIKEALELVKKGYCA